MSRKGFGGSHLNPEGSTSLLNGTQGRGNCSFILIALPFLSKRNNPFSPCRNLVSCYRMILTSHQTELKGHWQKSDVFFSIPDLQIRGKLDFFGLG